MTEQGTGTKIYCAFCHGPWDLWHTCTGQPGAVIDTVSPSIDQRLEEMEDMLEEISLAEVELGMPYRVWRDVTKEQRRLTVLHNENCL